MVAYVVVAVNAVKENRRPSEGSGVSVAFRVCRKCNINESGDSAFYELPERILYMFLNHV